MSTQPVQTLTPGISSEAAALRDTRAQRYTQLLLLVVAAGAIYPILYLRQVYQPTMLEVFHIDESQLGYLYSSLGTICASIEYLASIAYLPREAKEPLKDSRYSSTSPLR